MEMMDKQIQHFGPLHITGYRFLQPSLVKGTTVNLEIFLEGKGWLKLLVLPEPKPNTKSSVSRQLYLSFASSGKFISKIMLSKYLFDNHQENQRYYQTSELTIIYQKVEKTGSLHFEIPTDSQIRLMTEGFLGFGQQMVIIFVDHTQALTADLKLEFGEGLTNYDSTLLKDSLDKEIFEPLHLLSNKTESSMTQANFSITQKFESFIKSLTFNIWYESMITRLTNMFYKDVENLSNILKVPDVDLSTMEKKWDELTEVISK